MKGPFDHRFERFCEGRNDARNNCSSDALGDVAVSSHDTETEDPILISRGLGIAGQPPMREEMCSIEDSGDDIGVPDVDRQQHVRIVLGTVPFRYSRR